MVYVFNWPKPVSVSHASISCYTQMHQNQFCTVVVAMVVIISTAIKGHAATKQISTCNVQNAELNLYLSARQMFTYNT